MKNRALLLSILGVLVGAWSLTAAGDDDGSKYWPTWRGPLHNGVAPHGDPPTEWSETKNVRWKVELPGPGHATPVIWGDRIYVLAAIKTERTVAPAESPEPESGGNSRRRVAPEILPAGFQQSPERPQQQPRDPRRSRRDRRRPEPPTHVHQFAVLALHRATGKTIWQTVVREGVPHEPGHVTASQASASPITDGKHVWAFFGSRGLYCLDRDGKIVWDKDLGDMTTRNQFGEGASPVLHGNTIVVNWDHEGDSFIVALDKRSGDELWRAARDEPTSWSTPLVVEDGDRTLVVVSATNRVRAYDIANGEVVWECGGLGLNCAPTPVEDSGLVFVMSGYRDPAGMAIRYAGAQGDISDGDAVAWRIESGTSYVPSPLLLDGKLYFLERFKGMLSCLDLKSGEPCFEQQRLEGLGNIYASPVAAAGRIYVLDRDGKAMVFRHGETFELLAESKLDDAFDASPALAGDEIYLRGHGHLYCLAAPEP